MATETMTLEIVFPKDLLSILGLSRPRVAEAVREYSVLGLYQEHRLSSGKAAELLGMGKRAFVALLSRKGVPYFDYNDDELEEEFRTVDDWKRKRASS